MELIEKIKSKKAHIGIVGLGYVGLPLVTEFCKAGFQVAGFDIDERKVELLKQGKSYIKHIDGSQFTLYGRRFSPTSDFSRLADMDCIIICVPTPLNKNREPDMTYVFDTTKTIAQNLRKGQLIVLESTTYPGTTDEDMRSILEEKGLKAGTDFHLAFSPEREDPNRKDFSTSTIPKIVSGYTEACLAATKALYDSVVVKTVTVSSTKVAEATKLLENIYRAVNIALVNELKMLFDKMGIDVWEVIEAAKTKPFGFQAFYPGPGLGGHCIPIDPFYLTWKAREYEFSTRFIELAGEINTNMPHYVIQKTIEALNERGKSLKGSKILILGLAYKKDVDDLRESPSLKLIELLLQKSAEVDYNDPYIPRPPTMRKYKLEKHSVALTEENLAKYDAVVIATEHSDYNPEFILKNAELIVDTRNFIKNHTNHSDKVKRA
ncbi:MAG: nucleotide sugar dehydrogenase [Candidatus Brocadiaceae bacterium]|nr:nucleotide sugar dehydrogenase [Candidatus Brocadiaceae bacterium]